VSARDVTAKAIYAHLVLVPGPRRFAPFIIMLYARQYPHRSHCNYFSRSLSFRWNSFPEWPHIFFVSTIRQIIRLSPGTILETLKKRNSPLHTLFVCPSVSRTHKLTASTQLKNSTVGATCSCVYMCVSVCACVCERERVRECVWIFSTFRHSEIPTSTQITRENFWIFGISQCLHNVSRQEWLLSQTVPPKMRLKSTYGMAIHQNRE